MSNLKNYHILFWLSLQLFLIWASLETVTIQNNILDSAIYSAIQSRSRFSRINKIKVYNPAVRNLAEKNDKSSKPTINMTSSCHEPVRLPTATQLHKLPTILKGTLVEQIHSMGPKIKILFLFEINRYIKLNGNSDASSIARTRLSIPLSNQRRVSYMRRITHYVLVDDSALECQNDTLNIGTDYFLFLNKFSGKNAMNHPIRTSSRLLSKPLINIRNRRNTGLKLKAQPKQRAQRQTRPLVVLVKVEIFKSIHRPIEADRYMSLRSDVQQILCSNCERPVRLSMSKEIHRANLNQDIKLICSFSGNPEPEIFWKRYRQYGRIDNNNVKYTIEKIANYSILTIRSVEENDAGVYWCAARDYVTKDGNLTSARTRLVINSLDKYSKPRITSYSKVYTKPVSTNSAQTATDTKVTTKPITDTSKHLYSIVPCEISENTCQNGGLCMKTNPNINSIFRKKFCRCSKDYEGPNCEIKIVTSLVNFDSNEIPSELRPLWYSLGQKVSNANTA